MRLRGRRVVLKPANALITHNVARIDKAPTSGVAHPGEVTLIAAETSASHDARIVQVIRDAVGRRSVSGEPIGLRDIAIICHSMPTENAMKAALNSARIPIHKPDARGGAPVENGVELLTWRKAKGRQWKIVILPNSNDRVLPDEKSVREGDVKAQRRLYYVAMTRASERLVVGYVRSDDKDIIHRTMSGEVVGTNGASRFLFEAGLVHPPKEERIEAVVETVGPPPVSAGSRAPEQVYTRPAASMQTPPPVPAPATVSTTVAPETRPIPEPKVEVIVQPVKPAPDRPVVAKPAKRKRATKPWELRQTERQLLSSSLKRWDDRDYFYAVLDAWMVIEAVMSRVVRLPAGTGDVSMERIIDRACEDRQIEPEWASRFHTWRRLRNAIHPSKKHGRTESEVRCLIEKDPEKLRIGWEAVSMAPDFLAYLAHRVAPKQIDLIAMDDHLCRLTQLVDIIAGGLPHPLTGKPLKALRFDPAREALEMIPLQFLMVLKDVRFYTPEHYRWDRSPILGKFAADVLGGMPRTLRPSGNHGSANASRQDERRVYTYLERLLKQEAGEISLHAFLHRALEDGGIVGNGNYPAGLQLNPKSVSRGK